MVRAPATSSRSEPERQETASLGASFVISVIATAVVYVAYFAYSQRFLAFRNSWTEFVFHFPIGPFALVTWVLNVLFAYAAISSRKWLYFFPAALAALILAPVVAWEGPGYLYKPIEPLVYFLLCFRLYISLLAWLMVALWVTHLNAVDRRLAS
jgi:hypothetical protein